MKNEAEYLADQIRQHNLIGATLVKTMLSIPDPEQFLGLVFVRPDGTRMIAWVFSDPEGNAPGFLEFQTSYLPHP